LTALGETILLDHYAYKSPTRSTLAVGDTVVITTASRTSQRAIGTVQQLTPTAVTVRLADGTSHMRLHKQVDKPLETHPTAIWQRVAQGIAESEATAHLRAFWCRRFYALLTHWQFIPAGRILKAAGTDQQLTYQNTYVLPSPQDSRAGILTTFGHMTEIMARGGGVGVNLSSLRPRDSYIRGVNGTSSGVIPWGSLYSHMCGLIETGGSRRGALMLLLNDTHPDILEFICAKREEGQMAHANLSVGVSDRFMRALHQDADWPLLFPDTAHPTYNATWDGDLETWQRAGKPVLVHQVLKARALWQALIESTWTNGEPGVWFRDRANSMSNSWYYASLVGTNSCGEQSLPAWGQAPLGHINLSQFVRGRAVAWSALRDAVHVGVRFLDDVIDATPYFCEAHQRQQHAERRIGLGTLGLADMLIRLHLRYGSPACLTFLDQLYGFIATEAYLASTQLAAEKGAFPLCEVDAVLQSGFMQTMPDQIRRAMRTHGLRNVTLLTQAPTGTVGTLVNTSTGIEPFYGWSFQRQGRLGVYEEQVAVHARWQTTHPGQRLPDYFVTTMDLQPEEHIRVQAIIQRWTDASISKTCNVPHTYTKEQVGQLYELMYQSGCKGGTIYRDRSRNKQVLACPRSSDPQG
jgi:ribonucleoside-diphosphate reductase alpha chain